MTGQDRREVHLVDAFTTEPYAGNPAGVVPSADGLETEQMQTIAAELGASETAFVLESEVADRRLRYFTPEREVDLCGHATIAAHARLFERAVVDAGTHSLETEIGELTVEIDTDGTVWMEMSPASIRTVDLGYERLADVLGLNETAFEGVGVDLPIARISTGMPFLIVPVNYFEQLGDLTPDSEAIEALSSEFDVAGLYAFTFDTLEMASTVHGRLFAPAVGVSEDPVTGTASGAVGAYLRRFGGIDASEIRCEQGDFLDRPGRVQVQTANGIRVGGRAVTTLSGEIAVPEPDDAEIVEA